MQFNGEAASACGYQRSQNIMARHYYRRGSAVYDEQLWGQRYGDSRFAAKAMRDMVHHEAKKELSEDEKRKRKIRTMAAMMLDLPFIQFKAWDGKPVSDENPLPMEEIKAEMENLKAERSQKTPLRPTATTPHLFSGREVNNTPAKPKPNIEPAREKGPVYAVRQIDKEAYLGLRRQGISPVKARLYASRGVLPEQMDLTLKNLLKVSSLTDCIKAGRFLAERVAQNKKICVVADYDSDGATSAAVMVSALQSMGADVRYVVPDRHKHGYGLSPVVMDEVVRQYQERRESLPDLIVTVDNGIVAYDGVKRAKEMGMEIVVTDHHLGTETLPDADVLVNPNRYDCPFRSKAMAGCGVAWYVMVATHRALQEKHPAYRGVEPGFDMRNLLDYVAIGTVADVVPLDYNNRILIAYGLDNIRNGKAHPGVYALLQVSGVQPERIKTTDIAFRIAPRINAAGRLTSMEVGINCLLSADPEEARCLALELNELNHKRQGKEREISESAAEQIAEELAAEGLADDIGGRRTIVAAGEDWEEGVVGIVASRLKERFNRPSIVMSVSKEQPHLLKGSARSIEGFHFRDALIETDRRAPGVMVKYGGHAMAAGLTINRDKLNEFKTTFEQVAQDMLKQEDLQLRITVDGSLSAHDITPDNISDLEDGLWGQAFPPPTFRNVMQVVSQKQIGKEGTHKKLEVLIDGVKFDAVKWRCEDDVPHFIEADYTLNNNEYMGRVTPQLMIGHFRASADPRMDTGLAPDEQALQDAVNSAEALLAHEIELTHDDDLMSLSDLNML